MSAVQVQIPTNLATGLCQIHKNMFPSVKFNAIFVVIYLLDNYLYKWPGLIAFKLKAPESSAEINSIQDQNKLITIIIAIRNKIKCWNYPITDTINQFTPLITQLGCL